MIKKFEQKQPGVIATTDLSSAKGCTLYWIFFAVLIIVAAISIVPMIWTIATAFKDTQEIYSSGVKRLQNDEFAKKPKKALFFLVFHAIMIAERTKRHCKK